MYPCVCFSFQKGLLNHHNILHCVINQKENANDKGTPSDFCC